MADERSQPGDASARALTASASWFDDEHLLLSEVKRARVGAGSLPKLAGYDDLVELKRGGQGIVYAATQRSTKRKVALKLLLDSAYYSTTGKRRFEREVDLVAGLRHPGIVRVYDSGVSDDGRAYLVMEFIEGRPLDEHAGVPAKDIRTTLEVFAKVCDAVQHAHAKGVIHRDLKPSNIRVDEQGQPHVLDFGLAIRSDARDAAIAPTITTSGQFLGSLPWASPEQARGDQDQVDVRSDVYALGAMLYQLLTGVFPCDVSGSLPDALKNITEVVPTPARKRRATIDEQLEVILAKALEKDPAHRYQSVGDLASDLRHHLAGEPIAARRESAWRMVRRNAQRYRVAMVASGVVVLALAGTTIAVTRSARIAQRERDVATLAKQQADNAAVEAQRERDAAKLAKQGSDATVDFLSDILSAASPGAPNGGRDVKVLEVLGKAADEVDARFADQPLIAAQLHSTLGATLAKLEQFDKASAHHERALALTREHAGSDPEQVLSMQAALGGMAIARQDYAKGIEILEPLIATMRKQLPAKSLALATALGDLGIAYRRTNDREKAMRCYDEALAAAPDDARGEISRLALQGKRALVLDELGKSQEAEALFREILPKMESRLGPGNDETLTAKINYAYLLIFRDRPKEAIAQLESAKAASEASAGPAHLTTLVVMNNLAKAYQDAGDITKAEAMFREIVRRYDTLRSSDDPGLASPLNNLAFLLFDHATTPEGKAEAIAMNIRSRDITIRSEGENTFGAINAANNIGVMLEKTGRLEESAQYFVWIRGKLEDPAFTGIAKDHWYRDAFWVRVGNSLISQGKPREAEPIILKAYANLVEKRGVASVEARNAAKSAAKMYEKLDRPADAAAWQEKSKAPPAPEAK